jgi:hypothetical protein
MKVIRISSCRDCPNLGTVIPITEEKVHLSTIAYCKSPNLTWGQQMKEPTIGLWAFADDFPPIPEWCPITDEKVSENETTTDLSSVSIYAKFFDKTSPEFRINPELNRAFLRSIQNFCNDKLHINKYIFLNEVYDMLGISRTQVGQVVGWALTKDGENKVVFDITEAAVDGFLIDFNVYGTISHLIEDASA